MSWIIRSSTTPTSVERKVKPLARTASMYLGRANVRRGGAEGRIEPLDVADLEHDVAPPGGGHQLVGLGRRGAERLFDQQVDAGFEKLAGDAMVQAGGRGDHRGVELVEQIGIVGQRLRCGTRRPRARGWPAAGSTTATSSTSSRRASFWAWKPPKRPAPITAMRSLFMAISVSLCDRGSRQLSTLTTTASRCLRRSRPRPCMPSCWPCTKLSRWLTCGTSWPLARRISQAFSRPTFER